MSEPVSGAGCGGTRNAPAILFVDDEPSSVKYFTLAFRGEFIVLTAGSTAEAEALLASDGVHVGVLVTDQRMPVETGVQLLDRIKVRYPHIVRVLTTAYSDLDDTVAAVNRGEIYRFIHKPWDIEALRRTLRGAMELYRRKCHEQELLQARRRSMLALASHVAHELRTPLATIRTGAYNMNACWPDLMDAYRRDAARRGTPPLFTPDQLQTLACIPGEIQAVVDRANALIDMLLVNAREDADDRADYALFSVRDCVGEAVRRYPFKSGGGKQVRLEGGDFPVWGSEVLLSYVLYNLLRNAEYALQGVDTGGGIHIRLEPGDEENRLRFRDDGIGIAEQDLPHVFDEFYSGKNVGSGTGMGLPFCRRVLHAFGGSIQCRSEPGEYTELELIFPHPREKVVS